MKEKDIKIIIKSLNLTLPVSARKLIRERVEPLKKFIYEVGTPNEIIVEVMRTNYYSSKGRAYRAEINVRLPGKLLRVESEREDFLTAVNESKGKLKRLLERYKEKPAAKVKKGGRAFKEKAQTAPVSEADIWTLKKSERK